MLRLLGTPDCPVLVDICIDPDFAEDPHFIPGAFRHPPTDNPGLIALLDGRPSVVICQRGIKLSQGLAAQLRVAGLRSEYLIGGNYGWRALAGAPRVPASALPARVDGTTLCVTLLRPRVDRSACPWLIRRFVDPSARFLYVSPAEVLGVADRFGAVPFDIEGAALSHCDGKCTFDAMLDAFSLHTEALDRVAAVVRAADTNAHADAPQAAGLLALSVGLSRQYRDDNAQLDAGMAIYDALYRWARDGADEVHGTPGGPL